jgi:4-hydroxyproline epimerase
VEARYETNGPFVERVRITNVPSFLLGRGYAVEVEGLGLLTVDVAYGGNFYAIVEPQAVFSDVDDVNPSDILRWSPRLRTAFNARHRIAHPENPALDRLTHVLWTGRARTPGGRARSVEATGRLQSRRLNASLPAVAPAAAPLPPAPALGRARWGYQRRYVLPSR